MFLSFTTYFQIHTFSSVRKAVISMASICRAITQWFVGGTQKNGFLDDSKADRPDIQKSETKLGYREEIKSIDGATLGRPRPRFEDLPLNPSHPKGSAWGLWGEDDERGTLNLITDEATLAARQELRTGRIVPLK
jgi:hypothetical protein